MLQVSKFPEGTWLIFSNNWTSDLTFLSNIPIPLDSPFLLAEEVNTGVSLVEVYHVDHTRPLQKYKVADWNSVRGIVWFVNRRQRDLQGITIKAAYRIQVIYVVIHSFGRLTQSIKFVDPCIMVKFVKKNSIRCNNVSKFLLFHIYMILCLTTSTNYTSNNLLCMKNQRLPVQF